ncbi:MAG TPA: L,D-transpeptidase family protein [Dongiaceae bacterium]|nr:L,D-transpeptidase family protein [Dongiaceae bacterium]
MIRASPRLLAIVALIAVLRIAPAAADEAQSIAEILSAGAPPVTDIDAALGADRLAGLKRIYQARNAQPIWSDAAAKALLDRARAIAIAVRLKPLIAAAAEREKAGDDQALAERDLLLSAIYGAAARSLNPAAPADFAAALGAFAQAKDQIALIQPPPAPAPALASAPAASAPAPAPKPAATIPAEPPEIHRLTVALEAYRKIAANGGWAPIPDGPKLQAGDTDPRVEVLRKRLIATGDLGAGATLGPVDDELQDALRHFQARHGLPADGIAGAATVAALNVPVEARIASLAAAKQRLAARQWKDTRYLLIDIPGAAYRLVEDGKTALTGAAIVGRPTAPTPPLDGTIDRLALNPSWKIPQVVADARLWPLQDSDATYFYNHGIHVSDEGLRQDPGGANPLGHVKFLFDNPAGIALTGDPDPKAFDAPDRFTSLGCVALSGADDLARRLLAADPAWTPARIDAALTGRKTEAVTLAQPLPLHIVYDTAWVDADGTVNFRADVYGLDAGDKVLPSFTDPAGPCGS